MSFKSGEILIKGNKVTSINKDEMADSEKSLPSLSKEEIMFLLKLVSGPTNTVIFKFKFKVKQHRYSILNLN